MQQMQRICGANDRNVPYVELLLNGQLYVHGNSITYHDSESREESAEDLFEALMKRLQYLSLHREDISEVEIFMEYQALLTESGQSPPQTFIQKERDVRISVGGKHIYPKGLNQRLLIESMSTSQLTFAIGPAGTGKTFLAIAHALSDVLSGKRQKIVLTRPVVEAGESLGYLPGDLTQKISPYLRPLYDAMEYMVPPAIIRKLEDNGAIEVAPLAYMRGRSLNNASVILDEAQNTTVEQMKMFLTRMSENSQFVVTGDVTQIDLPKSRQSGLVHAQRILHEVEGIAMVQFSRRDVVRSRMVQRIITAYEKDALKE